MNDKSTLNQRITELGRLLHHRQAMEQHQRGGRHGAGIKKRILKLLKLQPEISHQDLAFMLDISSQELDRFLGKLEKKGLVTKISNKGSSDFKIALTEAGSSAADETKEQDPVFSVLDEQEQKQLEDFLDRLIPAARQELENSSAEYHCGNHNPEPEYNHGPDHHEFHDQSFDEGRHHFNRYHHMHDRGRGCFQGSRPGHGFGGMHFDDTRMGKACKHCPLSREMKPKGHRCGDCPKVKKKEAAMF